MFSSAAGHEAPPLPRRMPGHTSSVAKRGVIQLNFIVIIFIVAVHKCVHKLILHYYRLFTINILMNLIIN